MGLLVLVMHCQFGGRPLIVSALQEISNTSRGRRPFGLLATRAGELGPGEAALMS